MSETLITALPYGEMRLEARTLSGHVQDYIGFAARDNAKRPFLFLSKVLGKHYPVRPSRMQAVHDQLASRIKIYEGSVVFIGMAETATGLGQGVFEAWRTMNPNTDGLYIHTTRYRVLGTKSLVFEESHSHAPNQFLTLPTEPTYLDLLRNSSTVVLVDDELSTGNTFLHLIKVLHPLMMKLSSIHICTIADFMGEERRKELTLMMGLPCLISSLMIGNWSYIGNPAPHNDNIAQRALGHEISIVDSGYGRLGRMSSLVLSESAVDVCVDQARFDKTLVLGTGEFMHGAFVLGRAMEKRGCDIHIQSTTRSPILQWGAVSTIKAVPDAYGEGLSNYLYNVHDSQYDHIFICHESGAREGMSVARSLGGTPIRFAKDDHAEKNSVC
jgi:hypothetical protein